MKKTFIGMLGALTLMYCQSPEKTATSKIQPPSAEKKPFEIVASHGHTRVDNYYWMKEREDSAVIRHLEAENNYVASMMGHTSALQEKLFNEMKGRIKEKDESVPYRMGNYLYYSRFDEGFEYPVYCRKKNEANAPEEIVANGNELSKGQLFFDLYTDVSPDHNIANIITDTVGRRFYTIGFKDMRTGKMYPDKLTGTSGDVEWFSDNKTILYSKKDPVTLIANKIYRHTLGTSPSSDVLVYEEKDNTLSCSLNKSASKKYIFITSGRTDANFSQMLDAAKPDSKPLVIEPLQDNAKYYVNHIGDKLYIRTNVDAPNYKIVESTVASPGRKNWKDVIPHNDNVFLEQVKYFKDYLVLQESNQGLNKIRVIRWNDRAEYYIQFDEPAYVAGLSLNPESDSEVLRYSYQSMTTPGSVYDYNMATKQQTLMKQQEVLGGFSKDNYMTERIFATARDGKKIPISLVYRKDKFKKDGSNPCLQYGYGSYGYSMTASFSSDNISLLDRGFVYAIAHIRGGQEMGGKWYDDGKMMTKKNTFTDFIDCSEHLIAGKYTSSDKLFAFGGSAGGLLVGAVMNMRPDLYKGIIAAVPFVDVVTTMMDETIPLTTFEWKEWGNPNIKAEYDYMLSYSPYDNIEKKNYPNILVLTGFHDSQVQYWEPAKWVAKLREMKTDKNLLLFKTDMNAGHGGSYGRFERLKDTAMIYAFVLDLSGVKD